MEKVESMKVKSRWRKNYMEDKEDVPNSTPQVNNNHINNQHQTSSNGLSKENNSNSNNENNRTSGASHHSLKHHKPPQFDEIAENIYLGKRNDQSRSRKEARSMVCDCILTREERARGIMGCSDDCLNKMLMIECGSRCTLGDHCLNKRFQNRQYAPVEVFKTRKKGFGLRARAEIQQQSFIMEYVGEVVRSKEFRSRVKMYTKQKIKHHYFMALRSDEIIDATVKGNLTRFINHSCEPNCETQKWTVNGDLRIGFFTTRDLQVGDEITFDYQFQRYGKKAQKCYCDAPSCRGFIGGDEKTFSLNGHSIPALKENNKSKKSYKHSVLVDVTLEDKINALTQDAYSGLKTKDQVIALASLSIKAEEPSERKKLLEIIKNTKSEISLRLFVDYHGLEIFCLWMRDAGIDNEFKANVLDILERLPIPNKTKVMESNIYRMVERWANEDAPPASSETPTDTNTNSVCINESSNNSPNSQSQESSDDKIPREPDTKLPSSQPKTDQASTLLPQDSLSYHNIKALSQKLLKKFQALSPGFKIPRLSRLQRMEIEKNMDQEVSETDTDKTSERSTFYVRNHFFKPNQPSTNNIANSALKTNTLANKRRPDSIQWTNNIDLTPIPKMSKEEHRQKFEMHVRLKDYYDGIEREFGPEAVKRLKINNRVFPPPVATPSPNNAAQHQPPPPPYTLPGQNLPPYPPSLVALNQQSVANNHLDGQLPLLVAPPPPPPPPPLAPTAPTVPASFGPANFPPPPPHMLYSSSQNLGLASLAAAAETHYQQQSSLNSTPSFNASTPVTTTPLSQLTATASSSLDTEADDVRPEPTNLPTLIVVSKTSKRFKFSLSDEMAANLCDYDEYYTKRDQPLSLDNVLDEPHPYPGSYYTTPNGENWFATITLNRQTQRPQTVIFNLQRRSAD